MRRRIKFMKPEDVPVSTPPDLKVPFFMHTLFGPHEMMLTPEEATAMHQIIYEKLCKAKPNEP